METVTSLVGWVFYVLALPTHLFWPLGDIVKLAYTAMVIYLIYRFTPQSLGNAARRFVLPYVSIATRKLRNQLGLLMIDADALPRQGNSKPQIVYKEVKVARSVKKNIWLRVRWMMAGALIVAVTQNWQLIYAYFK
jgi:hypothetical protein